MIYNSLDPPTESGDPLPFEFPILLCGGRLVREKGFDVAIQALPAILQRFPNATLWIAGDGPERPNCRSRRPVSEWLNRSFSRVGLNPGDSRS